MLCLSILAASLFSCVNARVSFQLSTVLQASDIAGGTRVNFKCANPCKVYADLKSENLTITTQAGVLVTTFNEVVADNAFAPAGILLQPRDDYYLQNIGATDPDFVMYVVDSKAPNYGAPVYVPQETIGVAIKNSARYVTILSSFEAMWFSGFTGNFPASYPRIYAAPYDAVSNNDCRPVFQARSQYNAEMSWPTIASAVFTVDFGFAGAHNATVVCGKIKDMTKNAGMSTVYTSPGYVGCNFNTGQNYYSKLSTVQDTFSLQADSLDVDAAYTGLAASEPVTITISNKLNNWVGTGGYNDHFGKGKIDVDLSWTRKTPSSSFAIQMDFSSSVISTNILPALALVIASCLW